MEQLPWSQGALGRRRAPDISLPSSNALVVWRRSLTADRHLKDEVEKDTGRSSDDQDEREGGHDVFVARVTERLDALHEDREEESSEEDDDEEEEEESDDE